MKDTKIHTGTPTDTQLTSFKMQGNSMFPTIKNGDEGIRRKCSPNDLKIGDIVVFRLQDLIITHRLIKIEFVNGEKLFTAKGDKNYHRDKPFTGDKIIGQLVAIKRNQQIISMDSGIMIIRKQLALKLSNVLIPFYNFFIRNYTYIRIIISFWWNNWTIYYSKIIR